MAWQKGPGEGYGAAKADALVICSTLVCRAVYYQNYPGARRECVGFVVEDRNAPGTTVGRGKLSRDAWSDAFLSLGGRYICGVAIYPRKGRRRGARRHQGRG